MKIRLCRENHTTRNKAVSIMALIMIAAISSVSCSAEQGDTEIKSSFLGELKKHSYPETKSPASIPVFLWDFSGKQIHSYMYEQQVLAKTNVGSFSKESEEMGQMMTAKGALLIKSQGDHTANLVLKDMRITMKMNVGNGEEPKTMEQTAPPFVLQGMKEDGSASLGNSSQEMLLKMLFPLPAKSLKVGESVDVPAQMPFNAMGSLLQVKGQSRITLTKYVKIGECTCAQFDTDIGISELNVPSELEGDYNCSAKGRSVFFFDINNRRFVSGSIALLMQFSIDAPMPQMNIPGEKAPDLPKRVQMSMVSDNLIRVAVTEASR